MKVVKKEKKDEVQREVNLMKHLNHKNIVPLVANFQDRLFLRIVLPYYPENLFKFMRQKNKLTERRVATYVIQVLEALVYMHGKSIMHRDIKPENLLVNEMGHILVAD